MRDLWQATAMMALDPTLRSAVSSKAKTVPKDELKDIYRADLSVEVRKKLPDWLRQPDPDALDSIRDVFRGKKLHLALYELAEINRWFQDDQAQQAQSKDGKPGDFSAALEEYGKAIKAAAFRPDRLDSPGLLQAIGIFCADKEFREMFVTGASLKENGFDVELDEEVALREALTGGGSALAKRIFDLGWRDSCRAVLVRYDGFIHDNS